MNPAYLHLAVNHVPVLGVVFGSFLQILGMIRSSRELKFGALWLFLISGVAAVVSWKTGGGAAHAVMGLPGVERDFIHRHADAGEQAMIVTIVAAILSLVAWFLPLWSLKWAKVASFLFLLSALAAVGWMGWTANLGGQVRHTEIRPETAPASL